MISRIRKDENQVCRKDLNGQFKCPSNEPAGSALLAIPKWPKGYSYRGLSVNPSVLIKTSGEFLNPNETVR